VVLPTPPFWLAIAITRPIPLRARGRTSLPALSRSSCASLCSLGGNLVHAARRRKKNVPRETDRDEFVDVARRSHNRDAPAATIDESQHSVRNAVRRSATADGACCTSTRPGASSRSSRLLRLCLAAGHSTGLAPVRAPDDCWRLECGRVLQATEATSS